MRGPDRQFSNPSLPPKARSITVPLSGRISRPSTIQRLVLAAALLLASVAVWSVTPTSAAPVPYRIDLKVLLLDDDSPWVDAIENQMGLEGVPFTPVNINVSPPTRSEIT